MNTLKRLTVVNRHIQPFTVGPSGRAGTRQVKPIWILLKQETVSGRGISWAIWKKSAPRSRQITTPAPHHSVFYRPDAIPAAQPTASKHWKQDALQIKLQCINLLGCQVGGLAGSVSWCVGFFWVKKKWLMSRRLCSDDGVGKCRSMN